MLYIIGEFLRLSGSNNYSGILNVQISSSVHDLVIDKFTCKSYSQKRQLIEMEDYKETLHYSCGTLNITGSVDDNLWSKHTSIFFIY